MKLGFVILAHDNIFRLRQVVRYLAKSGAPIALHLDPKISQASCDMLAYNFADLKNVHFTKRIECHWGDWSLVEATILCTKLLLEKYPNLDYIQNISGSCLPVKSYGAMLSFLDHLGEPTDFIEAFKPSEKSWVANGLREERVTLYHPFNWKKSRRLFDLSVKIQRLVKTQRRLPAGLEIAFGSQWWCLSTKTLNQIFNHKRFDEFKKFFKSSWIPDESFFQTLVRHFSHNVEAKSLCYANFDHQGKPFILYDDHLEILKKIDCFFVRKVWAGSDQLYAHFLNPYRQTKSSEVAVQNILNKTLEDAKLRATQSRVGLISQFRLPNGKSRFETRNPYKAFVGFHLSETAIRKHFKSDDECEYAGHIFKTTKAKTEDGNARTDGAEIIRTYAPAQYLMQKIWHSDAKKLVFMAQYPQIKKIIADLARDPNCEMNYLEGHWLIKLSNRSIKNPRRIAALATIELRREQELILAFTTLKSRAKFNHSILGDVLFGEVNLNPDMSSPKIDEASLAKIQNLAQIISAQSIDLSHLHLENMTKLELPENVIELKKYKKIS